MDSWGIFPESVQFAINNTDIVISKSAEEPEVTPNIRPRCAFPPRAGHVRGIGHALGAVDSLVIDGIIAGHPRPGRIADIEHPESVQIFIINTSIPIISTSIAITIIKVFFVFDSMYEIPSFTL